MIERGWANSMGKAAKKGAVLSMLMVLWVAPLLLADDLSAVEPVRFKGPDGQTLPFTSVEETLDFLRTAEVVSSKRVGKGINNPRKVLLEKDGVRANAVFRDVKVEQFKKIGPVRDLVRDNALFEVAAFELSQALGIDAVPPTVERELFGTQGSLQLWLEGALSETKRVQKNITPPDQRAWALQNQVMLLFDSLIYNDDRNQGNILFDANWRLWMIDHTRGFRRTPYLFSPEAVWFCDSRVWERLQKLDHGTLVAKVGRYLYPKELGAILQRRDLLVSRIQKLIAERGAPLVLFNLDFELAKAQRAGL